MEEIRFDDIDALRARISDDFSSFGEAFEVTQEMIDRFADLTGDHQWIHQDTERTRRDSPFGGPIAHGFLTLSLLPRVSRQSGGAGGLRVVGQERPALLYRMIVLYQARLG